MFNFLTQRPEALLVGAFALLILCGTAALSLPACQAQPVSVVDTIFTVTSAVCITGLSTREVSTTFTREGQIVILALIQLGGLGIMTLATVAVQLFRGRTSFSAQAALSDAFFQGDMRGALRGALRKIVLMTLAVEAIGAVVLYVGMQRMELAGGDAFAAIFLSISAFCNAGFTPLPNNAIPLSHSPLVMWTIMVLVTIGGLGFTVIDEIGQRLVRYLRRERGKPVRWSLNTRVVLSATAVLSFGGAIIFLFTGLSTDPGTRFTPAQTILHALFTSVVARTAGFNSVDFTLVPVPTLMILIVLMFIGGAPGSTAGGVKVTSATIWIAHILGRLRGRTQVTLFERRVPDELVRRTALIISVGALWVAVGIFLLVYTERVGTITTLEDIAFEQVSAFGTVGLSTGITPNLSTPGKIWIMASMFVGRLGPLTLSLAVIRFAARPRFTYPEERVMIG